MAAPTTEQIKLLRDYEPALYFWGNPGDPDVERFFPSNAKRYLEKAALRLATTTSSYDWITPIIQANRISGIEGEGGTGTVYLGQQNSSGAPLYLEAAGKQVATTISARLKTVAMAGQVANTGSGSAPVEAAVGVEEIPARSLD